MKNSLLLALFLLLIQNAIAFELVVIQGLSKSKQTFITRNSNPNQTRHRVIKGQKATFTSQNVSLIAIAKTVSNEFVQWEIENNYTEVPFQRGEIVTKYDTTEHLWALTPEKIKTKYLKNNLYSPHRSLEAQFALSRGLSESTTIVDTQNIERGGLQAEASFRYEFNYQYTISYGLRYSRDIVNLLDTSIISTRLLAMVEGRYYFDPIEDFHNIQIGLGLGLGFGQSRTVDSGEVTSGNVIILPTTKILVMYPINKEYEFETYGAFESVRIEESNADDVDRTTNLNQAKWGFLFRKHL